MGFAYTVKDQEGQYFITCTVHQWADVFTRKEYIEILLDSLRLVAAIIMEQEKVCWNWN